MIYTHPGAKVNEFVEDYFQCLEQLFNKKKTFFILGDLNIKERSSQAVNYRNATESNSAFELIIKPTSVTDSTATVIDHMITNDKIHKLCPYLTNHYPTMYMINNLIIIKNTTKSIPSYRDRKSFNSNIFCDKLDDKFGELASNNFPLNHAIFNSVFDKFVAQITERIDRHAPLKHLSLN